jgi:hypothetical protein
MQFETVSKPLRFAFSKNICRSFRNIANRNFCKARSDWLQLPLAALHINRHHVTSKIRLTMPMVKMSRADRNPWKSTSLPLNNSMSLVKSSLEIPPYYNLESIFIAFKRKEMKASRRLAENDIITRA